jgi:uncharacterized repeat protein (TIGR03803 family)
MISSAIATAAAIRRRSDHATTGIFFATLKLFLMGIAMVGAMTAVAHAGTAVEPVLSPAAGTYTSAQTVTITSGTSGASIRYTTDDSTPSETNGTFYTAPVSITITTRLRAIAYETGYKNSAVKSGTYTIRLLPPVFSPAAGTYPSTQTVTITSGTSGVSIRYTTDGSSPSETNGTLYTGPVNITITTRLRAIAYETGYKNSAVKSGTYTIKLPPPAAPVLSPGGGTYTSAQTVTITSSGASVIYYTTDNSPPGTSSRLYTGPISISATTTLKAIGKNSAGSSPVTTATYTITPPPAAPVFSPGGGTYTSAQTVTITSAGANSIYYTTDGSPPTISSSLYTGPVQISAPTILKAVGVNGGGSSLIATATYTMIPPPAAPVFSPNGGTYPSAQMVTITSAGANSIYYTTDGSAPTSSSTLYSGSVSISATRTLKAIAVNSAGSSPITTVTYTITPPPAAPVFSPGGGTYTSAQTVTITSAGANSIYYTTDGSPPTGSSMLYSGPVSIPTSTTLQAIGVNSLGTSQVATGTYTINYPPTVSQPQITSFFLLHNFAGGNDGLNPDAGLIQGTDGRLYGTTSSGGVTGHGNAFAINTDGTGFNTLYSFSNGPDGGDPQSSLIQGTDSRLYGTTSSGGSAGSGTVFALKSNGTGFTVLYSFTGQTDGANPDGSLLQGADGRLYGTASAGGANSAGTVFALNSDGTGFTRLYSFTGQTDGASPDSGLIQGTDRRLYGTTVKGGAKNLGTVFAVNSDGTGFTTLYSFGTNAGDGSAPHASLIQGTDGRLYGTASAGGASGTGTLFGLKSDGTGYTTLYNFTNVADGNDPQASLIQASDGHLYGTATFGGTSSDGTVFVINPNGTGFTALYNFMGASDGVYPYDGFVQGTDGRLYGTASGGGASNDGSLFAVSNQSTVTAGSNITLRVAATGTGPLSYQWQLNGVDIVGTNSATLILTNVNAANAGSYTVVVTGPGGSVTSSPIALTVTVPTSPSAPAFTPAPGTYRTPQTVTITSTGAIAIYYTTDGNAPTSASHLYTGPISIPATTTLSAIGVNVSGSSQATSGVYTINPLAGSALVAGGDDGLWQDISGVIRLWGRNNEGQLGDGTVISRSQMMRVSGLTGPVTSAALGEGHGLAVMSGQVYAWGDNYFGQLGDGSFTSHHTPAVITSLTGAIIQVAAGDSHSLALRNDGTVWAWGGNRWGQLGDGTTINRPAPVQVTGLPANIIQVVAGARHSAALASDGTVWVWGSNEFGQLGNSTMANSATPMAVAALSPATTLVSGRQHLLALTATGTVWVWGDNHAGQLGLGTTSVVTTPQLNPTLSGIKALAAGSNHSVALDSNGTVWVWGANDVGQLGNGNTTSSSMPVALTLAGVQVLAAGYDHLVGVKADATLWAWGLNSFGQLGNQTTGTSSNVPIAVAPPND